MSADRNADCTQKLQATISAAVESWQTGFNSCAYRSARSIFFLWPTDDQPVAICLIWWRVVQSRDVRSRVFSRPPGMHKRWTSVCCTVCWCWARKFIFCSMKNAHQCRHAVEWRTFTYSSDNVTLLEQTSLCVTYFVTSLICLTHKVAIASHGKWCRRCL